MTIGERIKKIRVFRKMTMDELGGALGLRAKICLSVYPSMKPVPAFPVKI